MNCMTFEMKIKCHENICKCKLDCNKYNIFDDNYRTFQVIAK